MGQKRAPVGRDLDDLALAHVLASARVSSRKAGVNGGDEASRPRRRRPPAAATPGARRRCGRAGRAASAQEREVALEARVTRAHGGDEVAVVGVGEQVHERLGVGVRAELVALLGDLARAARRSSRRCRSSAPRSGRRCETKRVRVAVRARRRGWPSGCAPCRWWPASRSTPATARSCCDLADLARPHQRRRPPARTMPGRVVAPVLQPLETPQDRSLHGRCRR